MTGVVRIIGIDPGLRYTGWGVIDSDGNSLSFVGSGVVKSSSRDSLAKRLMVLYDGLSAVTAQFQPGEAAVEESFQGKNVVAALKLGHARSIALLVPAMAGLVVAEYSPNTVKKSVVGKGHADKDQIRFMACRLLRGAQCDTEHAADALAISITHAHYRSCDDRKG